MIELISILILVISLMIAIIGREIATIYTASYLGDNTSELHGRKTLNPLKHIDILGTVILPVIMIMTNVPILFGWAKPAIIDEDKIIKNRGINGLIILSTSGLMFNICIIGISVILMKIFKPFDLFILLMLLQSLIIVNISIAIFNLLPLPFFDGGNLLKYILVKIKSKSLYDMYISVEQHNFAFVLNLIVIVLLGNYILIPIKIIYNILMNMV